MLFRPSIQGNETCVKLGRVLIKLLPRRETLQSEALNRKKTDFSIHTDVSLCKQTKSSGAFLNAIREHNLPQRNATPIVQSPQSYPMVLPHSI